MHIDVSYTFFSSHSYLVKESRIQFVQDMELVYMRDDEWVFSGANDWNDDHSPADPDAFDPIFDSIAFMGQDGVLCDAEAPAQNGARNDFFPPASGGASAASVPGPKGSSHSRKRFVLLSSWSAPTCCCTPSGVGARPNV